MAMPLVPSYNTQRVYGTWVKQGGTEMRPGTYKVTVPVRVTNATDDVIIPQGVYETGVLNITPGVPSLDITVPCTDDADNLPQGWQLHVEVTFPDAPSEKYVLNVPTAGPEINLRTVVLAETLPAPKDVLIVGVAGGLTPLDGDAKVPLEFLPDDIGGGGASTVEELTDATTVGKAVIKATDAAAARSAIGAGTSSLALGTTSSTAKAGDYQPTAENISNATTVGRNVLKATDAAAARTAIGAGTSNLALGTTSSTAKAGDYQPVAANISDSTTIGRSVLTGASAAAIRTALGLGNVDNTADSAKPVSTAQAAADAERWRDRGAFTADTVYEVNDLVRHNNAIYRCITAHTSASGPPSTDGDVTYWERVATITLTGVVWSDRKSVV